MSDNGGLEKKNSSGELKPEQAAPEQPKEFKIAEIWIKEGQIILDASPEFWMDKLRALGLLDMCKEIVMTTKQQEKNNVVSVTRNNMMNFARRLGNKFKKRF